MTDARRFDDQVTVSGQIDPAEVEGLKAQGVVMLINNRPDGEDPGQPLASDIEEAAARAGITYRHIPILRGLGPADINCMREALDEAGTGKVFAFCRSGNRSALVTALARRRQGKSVDEVTASLTQAGADPSAIAHLL